MSPEFFPVGPLIQRCDANAVFIRRELQPHRKTPQGAAQRRDTQAAGAEFDIPAENFSAAKLAGMKSKDILAKLKDEIEKRYQEQESLYKIIELACLRIDLMQY